MGFLSTLSMRWKLVLTTLVVETVMLALLVANGLRLMNDSMQYQTRLRLQELSILLNAAIAPEMATQDYAQIADILAQSRREEGIEYFILTDARGRTLLADGWDDSRPPPPPQDTLHLEEQLERFDTRLPVVLAGQTYGHLQFGLSTRPMLEARQHLSRQSLIIAIAAIALSALLLSALAFWITRHLERLRRASEEISKGNFNLRIPATTADEVGQLSTAFNGMSDRIASQMSALRESEERFRSLLKLSTDLYWEQDANYRFTTHHTGRDSAEDRKISRNLIGKCRWELETTLSAEQWAAHRARLDAREAFRDLEYGVYGPNRRIRHYHVNGEPFFDAAGNFAGYRGTAVETTERKLAEASLRLAASVFAEASEGIVIADNAWRVVEINPMVSELTAFTRNELRREDIRPCCIPDDDPELAEEVSRSLLEKGRWRGESRVSRRDGSRFPALLTISAVTGADGATSNYILIFSDITAIKEQQDRLESLAHYDALTRLPNRILLAERLQQGLRLAKRNGELLAVAYLDLDGFKPVNDSLGHDAGDALLVEIADRLRRILRAGDTVARLGGDEFVLLLQTGDFGECEAALLRVLGTVSRPYTIKNQSIAISASIGVTIYPHDPSDADMLMRHADQAMYVAKQAGRNRYHFFDAELEHRVREQQSLLTRLQQALPAGELLLYYQPKVNMQEGKVIGAEALLRWQHPERGLLAPGAFLGPMEEEEFIIDIGEWVICSALRQMSIWAAEGYKVPLSVNIAVRQLQSPDFPERLAALLATQPEVPPSWLQLEIVETAAIQDFQQIDGIVQACLATGITFALDDFGTGYSSLTYFRRLPVHTLKIDQSFIRDMLEDPEDLAIVESVIGLAHAFHREIIAEGVETSAHGRRLLAMGCPLAQGYGIARPMPAQTLPVWIDSFRADPGWLT